MNVIRYAILAITALLYVGLLYNYVLLAEWSWYILVVILYAWFAADITLALVHFYLDYAPLPKELNLKSLTESDSRSSDAYQSIKSEKMQELNLVQKVAFDFKTHHLRPKTLGKRTFITLVSEYIIILVFPLLIVLNIGVYFDYLHHLVILYFLILSIGLSLGQYAHANTHKDQVHGFIKFLQKTHIFLPTKLHGLHHQTFTQSFCVLNGWSNVIVNPIATFILKKKWLDSNNLELH